MATLDAYTAGSVTRLAGADRYATAAAISAATFSPGTSVAFVALGRTFPDSLTAGAEAARRRAPILLVEPGQIPAVTAGELARLRPGRIVVVGGTGVVSDAVVAQLRSYAPVVERVAGADRYATATALSRASFAANSVATVYLATGTDFPDGLAAGPVAGLDGAPLLLVQPNRLPAAVADELRRLDPTTIVFVGGTGAISEGTRAAVLALWR
jgi:putative cell wall-binding protein